MKIKIISLAVLSLCLSQSIFAQTKTLDFYSSSGSNRYSIYGKVKDLKVPVTKNSILIPDANTEAYVKLNTQAPYHARFIESDLNLYQLIELNKGNLIEYKNKKVKIIGSQNNQIIAESDNNIIFIPFNEVAIPKSFLNDAKKGLKVTFAQDVNAEDVLFFSQPENQLRYSNTYESVIVDNKINITHYLNITNSSVKTFDNVYLNFFLSETNIQDRVLRASAAMPKAFRGQTLELSNVADEPSFSEKNIQNLKSISIKKPMTIYPNFNKIKYVDKSYDVEQYAILLLDDKYEIYVGGELDGLKNFKDLNVNGTALNRVYLARLSEIKDSIKRSGNDFENVIDVSVDKGDILPGGKIDVYEKSENQDKLIVSSTVSHTENKNLRIMKNRNSDLKITSVVLEEMNDSSEIKLRNWEKQKMIFVKLKSIEVENVGKTPYVIYVLGKKTKIQPNQKVKVST